MYEGVVARIGNKRAIKGADYIVSADVLIDGNVIASVITGIETEENALGIYFVPDIQLSVEYCEANNLLAKYNEDGSKVAGSGYLSDKRRITAVKMRGVKSDGLWMPINSLFIFTEPKSKLAAYKEGDKVGEPIAKRYPKPISGVQSSNNVQALKKINVDMPEHYDTDQFVHNLRTIENLPVGLMIWITEKLHGTSHRVGNVLHHFELKWYQKLWNRITQKWLGWDGYKSNEYRLTHGTRRVILAGNEMGYYGSNQFRYDAVGTPELPEGMILYGEIVGYANEKPIMPEHSTEGFKEAKKLYGNTFVYNYGNEVGSARFVLYRVTQEGIDLPFEKVQDIAKNYGYECVPVLDAFYWDGDINGLVREVNELTADIMQSKMGNHPSEGVVIRIGNKAFKHKTFAFKVMEGIVKVDNMEDVA